jgi:hypothetical protein
MPIKKVFWAKADIIGARVRVTVVGGVRVRVAECRLILGQKTL